MRKLMHIFLFAFLFSLGSGLALAADDYGTSAEAKAMLERAIAALKKDQSMALAEFTKGEGGFKEKDLYPYCGGPDGNFTAHPNPKLVGKSLINLKDKAGMDTGKKIYAIAEEGKIAEVNYMWPRPGEDKPSKKVAYVTKVGDQICAVGYYEQ